MEDKSNDAVAREQAYNQGKYHSFEYLLREDGLKKDLIEGNR